MPHSKARLSERLFAALQLCLPTRLLSTVVHRLAAARIVWFKQALINTFCRLYQVDMSDAAEPDHSRYPSFNAFFTRELKAGSRPLEGGSSTVAAPVDGRIGALGAIESDRLFQAKGMVYNLGDLLAQRHDWTQLFAGGSFATLYLAPHNYHRIHMPIDARLRESVYVPGRLFGVNPAAVRTLPRLFTRNERLNCLFETQAGPMALIMVGAFCVGGMQTRWLGTVCPPHRRGTAKSLSTADGPDPLYFMRGEEMGRFNLGSTVILLFGRQAVEWQADLTAGQPLRLGQSLGQALHSSSI